MIYDSYSYSRIARDISITNHIKIARAIIPRINPIAGKALLSSFDNPISPSSIANGPKIIPSKKAPPNIPMIPKIIDNIPNVFPQKSHLNFFCLIIFYRE